MGLYVEKKDIRHLPPAAKAYVGCMTALALGVAGYCAEEAAALSAVLGYRQRGARQNRKAG